MSFLLQISLGLFMWKKRREQKTHVLELLREVLVPTWYRRRTSNRTSLRTRTSLRAKKSLMARTRCHNLPTSRRKLIRRKEYVMFAVILDIGLRIILTALIGDSTGRAARPQML